MSSVIAREWGKPVDAWIFSGADRHPELKCQICDKPAVEMVCFVLEGCPSNRYICKRCASVASNAKVG